MRKGTFYVGVMVLLLGALFLVLNVGAWFFPRWEILRIGRLWPVLVIWAGLAFYLPIFVWWGSRSKNYGLAMPGTIILINGLILLYCSLTGRWEDWVFLWTLEPLSVALGLLALWLLGPKASGLLIAALLVGGASLALFAVLASALGGLWGGIIGAGTLILLGAILVIRALIRPSTPAA